MAAIDVDNLEITFPLYHGAARSLKGTLATMLASTRTGASAHLAADRRSRIVVSVLRSVSFSISQGERVGLIGGNGAGKTTLLRALGGIYEPVAGRVRVQGRLGTFLDAQLGMNSELTGRENIALRGRYFGLDKKAEAALARDVADFADLDAFMDMPVKTYSSGMVVRLAFGLATAILPEVLLMDEWFMAGDAAFLDKARRRIETLVQGADILVVSTHQPDILKRWCTRVIWLENGQIRMDGAPENVLDAYLAS